MATGSLDANGIWQYGEDDSEPTFSGMLNKLASSTSTTVTRLEELSGLTAAQLTTHRDNLGVGLVNVVPTSVAQAGGSASANAQGLVTFTGVTSVSLNGVFTSAYTTYKVIFECTGGVTDGENRLRMRAAGVDASGASDYGVAFQAVKSNGTTGIPAGGTSFAFLGWASSAVYSGRASASIDIFNPALAKPTELNLLSHGTSSGVLSSHFGASQHNLTNSYDGFTVYPSGGNITGTIQVFGYNN